MNINNITNSDMIKAENLLRIVSKGRYDLSGTEAMAFVDACMWLGRTIEQMKVEIEAQKGGIKVKKEKNKMSGPKPKGSRKKK